MVQVKYGDVITEMKGKIGGFAYKGNYSAPSAQKIIKPTPRGTNYQTIVRARLSYISALWRGLTAGQKDDWNTLATTWPFINCFGEEYFGSGYQVFMQVNLNLALVGTAYHTTPADKVSDWEFSGVTGDWDYEGNAGKLQFDNINTLGNWRIYLQSCMPLSLGQFHTPAKFHYLNEVYSTGGATYWNWQPSYDVRFVPNSYALFNTKIVIRIKMVNTVTGQSPAPYDLTIYSITS